MKKLDLTVLEKVMGYCFNDKSILMKALSHSSYANENKSLGYESNERLEFLGDAVLELISSSYIFKQFLLMPEGEMTKLRAGAVCETTLAKKAREIDLGKWIMLGKGEEITGGRERDSILADAFEAVIGAVYLDGGIEKAEEYVLGILSSEIELLKDNFRTMDCKTRLQELIQQDTKEAIIYTIIGEEGPDHNKVFTAQVENKGQILGTGKGKNKKEAEQNAAYDALGKIEN